MTRSLKEIIAAFDRYGSTTILPADEVGVLFKGYEDAIALLELGLNQVRRCSCCRPATYTRLLCDVCDECARDPEMDWAGAKEQCLLKQAEFVRAARKLLGDEDEYGRSTDDR